MRRSLLLVLALASGCSLLGDVPDLSSGLRASKVNDASTSDAEPAGDGGVVITPSAAYAAAVRASQPEVFYRFAEKSGDVAVDTMGRHHGKYLAGVDLGMSGIFDDDSCVRIRGDAPAILGPPPELEFNGRAPYSFEVWLNPRVLRSDHGMVLMKPGGTDGGWQEVGAYVDAIDGLVFERYVDEVPLVAKAPIATDRFTYAAMVYDGTSLRLYLDANLVDSKSDERAQPPKGGPFAIGFDDSDGGRSIFDGSMDELAIYSRALKEEEIRAHYEAAGRRAQ